MSKYTCMECTRRLEKSAFDEGFIVCRECVEVIQKGKASKPEQDLVNHPPHYTSHKSGVECIEITRHMRYNLGNALKYIWRADLKHESPIQDLEKAIFYLNDEIERVKNE